MSHKYVYLFTEGNANMRELLGGKGANLAEMTNIGLPVPQGFTISTEACTQYYADGRTINDAIMAEIMENVEVMEKINGKQFGSLTNPLLVSVRSGARASMPGMMDTILNLGLNDDVVAAMIAGNPDPKFERFVYDSYRRFIQMFSDVVMEVGKKYFEKLIDEMKASRGVTYDVELTAADLKSYSLGGTAETIPEFREVLKLLGGSVPMVIELKTDGDNFNRLAETACRALEGYEGLYCIESFDPRCIRWLKKNRPRIVRGQLSDNFLREESGKASLPLRFVVTFLLSDCLTRPDFIAYHFPYRGNLSVRANGMLGVQRVGWTIRSQQELDIARKKGWIPIFEGFTPKP